MSKRYQTVFLKGGLAIAIFLINLFGLWSFRFVHCKSQIQYSRCKALYSICVLVLGMCTYSIIGSIAFSDEKEFFGSFTLRLMVTVYAQSVLVSFLFAYLAQLWFEKDIAIAYNEYKNIMMNQSLSSVDFGNYLPEIILKTIVIEIAQAAVAFNNMTMSSELLVSRPYLTVILMLPPIAVHLHLNIFYIAVVAIDIYIKNLNSSLVDIGSKIDYINGESTMYNYCYFSDEIDKISASYFKLVQATKDLNKFFSIHITLWNVSVLLSLTLLYLFQFMTIIELMFNTNETAYKQNMFSILAIIISSIDLIITSYNCQRIVNAVRLPTFQLIFTL